MTVCTISMRDVDAFADPLLGLRSERGRSVHQLPTVFAGMRFHSGERANTGVRPGTYGVARTESTSEYPALWRVRSAASATRSTTTAAAARPAVSAATATTGPIPTTSTRLSTAAYVLTTTQHAAADARPASPDRPKASDGRATHADNAAAQSS